MALVQNENRESRIENRSKKCRTIFFFPDDYGLRNPVISSETLFAKKRYTSIVSVVSWLQQLRF